MMGNNHDLRIGCRLDGICLFCQDCSRSSLCVDENDVVFIYRDIHKYMLMIYLAGPYTADSFYGVKKNILNAEYYRNELLKRGWSVFCPHKNNEHLEVIEDDVGMVYRDWLRAGITVMKRCDAIFMMPDWRESNGSVIEHDTASELGIQIFYSLDVVPKL